MRENIWILKDLVDFYKTICNLVCIPDLLSYQERFLKLRDEVKEKFPQERLFNKLLYTTSSFEYNLEQMRDEADKLINILLAHSNC